MSHLTQPATHKAFISIQTSLPQETWQQAGPSREAHVVFLYNKGKQHPVCDKGNCGGMPIFMFLW